MDVGVIGVGAMGRNHVRVYSELKSVGHLGVCDVNAAGGRSDRASSMVQRFTLRSKNCSRTLMR